MDARNELKGKRGLVRLLNATRYSLAGYKAAWQDEEAFRQICLLAVIGLPLACRLGRDWAESVLLAVPLVLCLLVELLNSAIENVVDRISRPSFSWLPSGAATFWDDYRAMRTGQPVAAADGIDLRFAGKGGGASPVSDGSPPVLLSWHHRTSGDRSLWASV